MGALRAPELAASAGRRAMTLDLLRFTTAGSVDDGKSTLIGRLLYDTKQVFEDQLEHVAQASERRGGEGTLDLALLTDGLRAEREQGITIDVAYRYFATAKRRFIIADCPGHQQYTRNMVTGASTADVSVVLLDARRGVLEQSKRHAFISALLGIPQMVVAVNKMDLVDHSQRALRRARRGVRGLRREARAAVQATSPTSRSPRSTATTSSSARRAMPWYDGPALLELLEQVEVAYDHPDEKPARFPVQWVIRPAADGDGRTTAATPASSPAARCAAATRSTVLPGGGRTRIAAIDTYDGELDEAMAPMSLTLRLEDELDVSRGELICHPDEAPRGRARAEADVCWMTDAPLRPGSRYVLKHTSRSATAIVDEIDDLVDVHTLERIDPPAELALNDIGRVRLRTSAPLVFDPYTSNRRTGSFILIDEASNRTVGAGMIAGARPEPAHGRAAPAGAWLRAPARRTAERVRGRRYARRSAGSPAAFGAGRRERCRGLRCHGSTGWCALRVAALACALAAARAAVGARRSSSIRATPDRHECNCQRQDDTRKSARRSAQAIEQVRRRHRDEHDRSRPSAKRPKDSTKNRSRCRAARTTASRSTAKKPGVHQSSATKRSTVIGLDSPGAVTLSNLERADDHGSAPCEHAIPTKAPPLTLVNVVVDDGAGSSDDGIEATKVGASLTINGGNLEMEGKRRGLRRPRRTAPLAPNGVTILTGAQAPTTPAASPARNRHSPITNTHISGTSSGQRTRRRRRPKTTARSRSQNDTIRQGGSRQRADTRPAHRSTANGLKRRDGRLRPAKRRR